MTVEQDTIKKEKDSKVNQIALDSKEFNKTMDKPKTIKPQGAVLPKPRSKSRKAAKGSQEIHFFNDEEKKLFRVIDNIYNSYRLVSQDYKKEFEELPNTILSLQESTDITVSQMVQDYLKLKETKARESVPNLDMAKNQLQTIKVKVKNELGQIEAKTKVDLKALAPKAKEIKDKNITIDKEIIAQYKRAIEANNIVRNESLTKYNKALEEERKRFESIMAQIENAKLDNDNQYAKILESLKSQYEYDINAFNKQIRKMHDDYYGKIDILNEKYEQKFLSIIGMQENIRAKIGAKIGEHHESLYAKTELVNAKKRETLIDDKAAIRALEKSIKLKERECCKAIESANKDLSKELGRLDKIYQLQAKEKEHKLKSLRQEFIKLIPTIENKIRKRGFQLESDILKEKNSKQISDNEGEIAVFVEKSNNAIRNTNIENEYKMTLYDCEQKDIIINAKMELDAKLIQYEMDVFMANESHQIELISLYDELQRQLGRIELQRAEEEYNNIMTVSEINNRYSMIDLEIDIRFNILIEKVNNAFSVVNSLYRILNKRNDVNINYLSQLSDEISQASLDSDQSIELFIKNLDAYILVKETMEETYSVQNDMMINQESIINYIKAKYDNDKSKNKALWEEEILSQEAKYNDSIAKLDKRLAEADYDEKVIASKNKLQKRLDELLINKNKDVRLFDDIKATSEKNQALEINRLDKMLEDERLRYYSQERSFREQASNIVNELDATNSARKREQDRLDLGSNRLTIRAIRYLLRKGKVHPKNKWWK